MRIGLYRHYADVEAYTKASVGDRGQPVGSWAVLYSEVPCAIDELQGRQLELARQLVATATHKVCLRYLSGIVPMTTRVNLGGRLLKIEHVGEYDMRGRYLCLTCTEQKSGAS